MISAPCPRCRCSAVSQAKTLVAGDYLVHYFRCKNLYCRHAFKGDLLLRPLQSFCRSEQRGYRLSGSDQKSLWEHVIKLIDDGKFTRAAIDNSDQLGFDFGDSTITEFDKSSLHMMWLDNCRKDKNTVFVGSSGDNKQIFFTVDGDLWAAHLDDIAKWCNKEPRNKNNFYQDRSG